MGLINLLSRRPSADAACVHHSAPPHVRGTNTSHGSGSRMLGEWQRSSAVGNQSRLKTTAADSSASTPVRPRLVGISEGRPSTASDDDAPEPQQRPKTTGRNPKESIRGLAFTLASHGSERDRLNRRIDADRTCPSTNVVPPVSACSNRDITTAAGPRRKSSAFVDILDAQGEIKPYDFRSRLQASGSRDYGEDVADRNLIERAASLSSPSAQASYACLAASSVPYRPRGSVSAASAYRNAHMTEVIPEQLEESALGLDEPDMQPSWKPSTPRESPRSKRRLSIVVPSQASRAMSLDWIAIAGLPGTPGNNSTDDDLHACRAKARTSCGRISVTGHRAPTPQRPPKTSAGPYMRDDSSSLHPNSRSASPPGVPRYKPRQCSLPTDPLPSRPVQGSVRSAREALNNTASAHLRDRAASPYQPRCDTPSSLTSQMQHAHYRPESSCDWSRFNKNAFGEHLQPSMPVWDDSSSANSEHRTFSFSSSARSRLDEMERQIPVRSRRQGSISSFTPSDHSSPRFTGSRSIRTADTSIDLPLNSLFREMKFGDGSSRSICSRGGDSSIAPDFVGPEEDSGADSIFISPATPLKEEADPNPLSGTHLEGGFHMGGYESASIYDSDTDSFREKRRGRQDGEALLFRDKGFGGDGKSLPGLFDDSDSLPTPKWLDMPVTPTEPSEMGDDEESIVGGELILPKPRQNSTKPFTQRERLLALGYDYDSDSDVEASVDTDEIPEERALMLLSALVEASASTPTGPQAGQALDMSTVVKLRRDIKRRKRTGGTSRRGSRFSAKEMDGEAEVAMES